MQLNEVLLGAWLKISTAINNSRLVSEMSYNESLICNILYRNATEHPDVLLTATDLCAETKILRNILAQKTPNQKYEYLHET